MRTGSRHGDAERRLSCPGWRVHHAKLWRGVDGAAVGCERGAQPGRHVAAVKGSVTRGNASEIAERFARGHEGWGMAQVGVLAGAWNEPQDTACAVRTDMELGTQAATAAPEALRFRVAARCAPAQTLRVSQSMWCCPAAPARPQARPGAAPRTPGSTSRAPTSDGNDGERWASGQGRPAGRATVHPSGRSTTRLRQSAAASPRRASQRQSLRDFASTRNLPHREHQRRPQDVVQAGPGHGRATPEASNTPRVARPETGSEETQTLRNFGHRP